MKKQDSSLINILKILSDGKCHDGNTIGCLLGITRSAVWKALKKLKSYGVEITSMKSKGYKLLAPLKPLDTDYILSNVESGSFIIDIFESIDSTSEYLKKIPLEKYPRFCMAEQQTLGRGRLGRIWHSPFGQNIYLSCCYLFQKDISGLAGLSLVVALAVARTLKDFISSDKIKLKWPNDIVFDDKKIAGVLIDINAEANGLSSAIIGIGLNVNMDLDKDHQISQSWTSMRKITEKYSDRNEISVLLIENLLKYLRRFIEKGFAGFADEWQSLDYLFGKKICLKFSGDKICGAAKGIDQYGQLLLELADGSIKAFSSGDVCVCREDYVVSG